MYESTIRKPTSQVDERKAALLAVSDELQSLKSLGNVIVEMQPAGYLPLKASSILTCGLGVGRLLGRLEILTRLPMHPVLATLTKEVTSLSFDIAKAIGEVNFRQQIEGLRRANEKIPAIQAKIDDMLRENQNLASDSLL